MYRVLRPFLTLLATLWLACGVAWGQEDLSSDLERWDTLATRAEAAVDLRQGSDNVLEALRSAIAVFRAEFDAARDFNADRIATLREQIAALGPAPEGEGALPESPEVTAKRTELTEQLNALLVPVQQAEAEFVRADALIRQIDQILRERQADQLMQVTPTPLNPAYWEQAIEDLTSAVRLLRLEAPERQEDPAFGDLRQALPIVILLAIVGGVLILRGRPWSFVIVNRLNRSGARHLGIWRFLASLLRIVLPFAGLMLLALAAVRTNLFGPKGDEIILTLATLGGIMLSVRWVSERVFSRNDEEALLALPPARRSEARFYVVLITVMIILTELIVLVLEAGLPVETSKPVLTLPFYIISSLALLRIGLILRGYRDPVPEDEDTLAEVRASSLRRIVRLLGIGAVVVGAVSPLLLVAGYYNATDALLPPYIMTLVLLGLVMVLQRFAADVYGALTGQGVAAREALLPVLAGMVLLLLMLPVLALVWGARVTDLTELWTAFGRGFVVGETRISPSDFLAFAIIFVLGYIITRVVQSSLRGNVLPKTRLDTGAQNAVVSGVGYIGIFLAALAAITGAGIDLSSIALVAGALSLGIGFGLQTIVSNFVSGIILLIERPISEGDWIEVGGQMGYVRDISVRATRIETFDRTDVIVPNADLVSGTVTNYTRGNKIGRVIVPVGVAYGTDTERVDAILREIAQAQPMVLAAPPPNVLFVNFGADALEFEVRAFLRDVNFMMVVKNDINHAIAKRFAEEGIEIPFAQRDLWLRNPEALRGSPPASEPPEQEPGA